MFINNNSIFFITYYFYDKLKIYYKNENGLDKRYN